MFAIFALIVFNVFMRNLQIGHLKENESEVMKNEGEIDSLFKWK